MPRPYISAVITCLNEEKTIEPFIDSLIAALEKEHVQYEIIIVNDGSADGTFGVIKRLFERSERVLTVLDLMKNAGQAAAITAGLAEVSGDYILMMDSDLQLFPSDVSLLIASARQGADMVNGSRQGRQDPLYRRFFSIIANWVMKRVAGVDLKDFGCTFRLVDRRLVDAFDLGPGRTISLPLLLSRAGRISEVPVAHQARPEGRSGWTLRKLWRYQSDNMVVLAEPLFQWVALCCLAFAGLLLLRVCLDPFLHWSLLGTVTPGLILNAIVVATLVVIALLCAIGEFVVRSHRSVLARPAYIIRERISRA